MLSSLSLTNINHNMTIDTHWNTVFPHIKNTNFSTSMKKQAEQSKSCITSMENWRNGMRAFGPNLAVSFPLHLAGSKWQALQVATSWSSAWTYLHWSIRLQNYAGLRGTKLTDLLLNKQTCLVLYCCFVFCLDTVDLAWESSSVRSPLNKHVYPITSSI